MNQFSLLPPPYQRECGVPDMPSKKMESNPVAAEMTSGDKLHSLKISGFGGRYIPLSVPLPYSKESGCTLVNDFAVVTVLRWGNASKNRPLFFMGLWPNMVKAFEWYVEIYCRFKSYQPQFILEKHGC